MENTLLETRDNPKYQKVFLTYLFPDILPTLVPLIPASTLISILLTPAKRGRKRPQKYLIQTNLFISLDIYFVIDNLHYDNINVRLSLYILSKQIEISEFLKKRVFQIINAKVVPIGIWVFNSKFVNKIKNANTDKTFEKSCLVM